MISRWWNSKDKNLSKRNKFKNDIVQYLRQELNDEGIDLLDVFKYTGSHTLQITHFAYRNLKDCYEFLDIEFSIDYNIKTFGTMSRGINGLFYYTTNNRDGTIHLWTTDYRFVFRLKLCGFNFNHMIKKYKMT